MISGAHIGKQIRRHEIFSDFQSFQGVFQPFIVTSQSGNQYPKDMIQVIPSIAIRKGKVVKMRKGDPSSEKAYNENPLDLARRFEDHGIEVVHLVDLDGAEKGSPVNWHVLEAIA